ncbi:GTF2B [Cordylochernes scorpioides]|uniref:Transcription initiation factor IIB n=1 Tax=Cordylochernes scorpioides TaxID=51811 RepID=A0ABY6L3C4_9ARAC|nr:GTF2B [Cordylochernes scorpioides]
MTDFEAPSDKICCKYHPNAELLDDYTTGDVVCPECGLVVGDRIIEFSPEWRNFSDEGRERGDPCRVGAPENPLLSGSDLFTCIGASANGNREYDHKKGLRLNNSDRALLNAFRDISEMTNRINLPQNIVERTNLLFKQVYERKTIGGKSLSALASACLYIACRQEGVPRSFKEICAVSTVSKKEIGRCFRLVVKDLETNLELITSGDFMARFCANLGLSGKVQTAATHIAKRAVDLNLVAGRSPISVAAASIYMASQALATDKKNPKEIGDIAGVAEVTLRQSYKLLFPRAAQLFPRGTEKAALASLLKL